MKKGFFITAALALSALCLGVPAEAQTPAAKSTVVKPTAETQAEAVKGLIARRFPTVKSNITVEIIAQENGKEVFEVADNGAGKIVVRGSTGVAAAQGLNWYMKHVCNQMLSWCGSNINITPATMKAVPNGKFRQILPHKHIAYMNYCTLSYSAPFWNWERWEWEIDFMALNGINMPLGMTGLEAAWYNALTHPEIGFTDEEARKFLVGPAHMAWQWMQNIENSGAPLPMEWIESHKKLGRQILDRERSFGMTPIQQGFSGHVPNLFKKKFPNAKIRNQGKWCNWPGVAQLDPTDPLFVKFGKIFIEEEGKIFGFGGLYAADPFHESAPPSNLSKTERPIYLKQVGENILGAMQSADPNAVWVMQAWHYYKEIIQAVPHGKLMVLDLNNSKWKNSQSFWGHNFCTGQLHNFGGRINMHGDIRNICTNPFVAAKKDYPATALGSGLFMEGITQNPVFYESVFDMWWRNEGADPNEWIKDYTKRRYGVATDKINTAWQHLLASPYRKGTNGTEKSSIIAARPAIKAKKSGPNAGFELHQAENYVIALDNLLAERDKCKNSDGYRFDVADLSRQVLSNLAYWIHLEMAKDFEKKDVASFKANAKTFQELLMAADRICETRREYRFSDWLNDARDWMTSEADKNYMDKNATMLVTYWGPEGSPTIFDYGWREWSGLIREYYAKRWAMFHTAMIEKLEKGEAYDETKIKAKSHGREAWRSNDIYAKMADWEESFVNTPKAKMFPRVKKSEDEITVALELQKLWRPIAKKAYKDSYKPID